jgi:two-component system, cell cycle response regulator DivK
MSRDNRPPRIPPKAPGGALILLIDDNDDNRELYAQYLTFHGWRVATAVDGLDGLVQAAALKPDAIVLDLSLPKLDGWEVARQLKADPVTAGIPVLTLTGHALDASRKRAVEAGVDAYLVKPCLPQVLLAEIQRHLRG